MNNFCTLCQLYKEATKQCLPSGSLIPDVYIIGEAPGKQEDAAGVPFVGRSGSLLRKCLSDAGFHDNSIRIFNIVRCIPRKGSGVRPPTDEEKEACHTYLFADIIKTAPDIILTLGGSSSSYLLKDQYTTISAVRGKAFPVRISYDWYGQEYSYSTTVIPTFHPSYLLHTGQNPELMKKFRDDLALAKELSLKLLGEQF